MGYIIKTYNLTKEFQNKLAVDNVSIHINKGDIYGFIGRNGAGKTTTLKLILGLLTPTKGTITLFGNTNTSRDKMKIGALIEQPGLFLNTTAHENLKRFSLLSKKKSNIDEILTLVGLNDVKNKKVKSFSLGMKQRLGIAIALLGEPEVLILDEPLNGLDPVGIKEIREAILRLNKEKGITFIISSHILDELIKITSRYGIIKDGKLVEEIEAKDLLDKTKTSLKIVVDKPKDALNILKANKLLKAYKTDNNTIFLYDEIEKRALINKTLIENEIEVSEMSINEASLENYFLERI